MLSWVWVALLQPRELREQLFRVAMPRLLEELCALRMRPYASRR